VTDLTTRVPTEPPVADEGSSEPPHPPARSNGVRWLLLGLLAAALAVAIAVVAASSDDSPPVVEVDVPAGTGAQLDAGEVVEVVPAILRLEPGGAIEIANGDERLHVLGSLRVDAGETGRLAFAGEGRYLLPTSLRSDGQVTVLVEDPGAAA
jgi:hypothetical protein